MNFSSSAIAILAGSFVLGAVSNPYPFSKGDQFVYAYVSTHSEKPAGKPLEKFTTKGTITTTIGATAPFRGKQLTDVNHVTNYTTTGTNKITTTGTTTSDDYETFASTKTGLDYLNYGDTESGSYTDSNGVSGGTVERQVDSSPNLLNIIPEVGGATWNPEIGYTLDTKSTTTTNGVTTTADTVYARASDGSYRRTIKRTTPGSPAYSETDVQGSDGSGQDENSGKGSTGGTTTFSAPALVSGQYVITVTYTPPSGSPTTTLVPDWFPGNGPAGALVTDVRKDLGTVKVPADCGATAGQQAALVRELTTALDVVDGTYNEEAIDSYIVAGEGKVCVSQKRLLRTYANRTTGLLLTSETFNEVQGLTSESLGGSRR